MSRKIYLKKKVDPVTKYKKKERKKTKLNKK